MSLEEDQFDEVYTFVESTLVDSFIKLARVNILTGEYEFLKKEDFLQEEIVKDASSIYDYIRNQVDQKLVLAEFAGDYLKYADAKYVQERIFSGERRTVQSFKRKTKDGYIWVTFGIVAPQSCSPENPWALFCWRQADTDTTTMLDALSTLSVIYYKILKINLTADTFEVVKTDREEQERFANRLSKISDWWKDFEESGNIYTDDVEEYRHFTDLEYLRAAFREDNGKLSCCYRRKIKDTYRWVQMDLVPSIEYTDENQVLILYVKDIHEEYLMEQENRRQLVDNYHRDALTFLYNRHKFNEDLEEIEKDGSQRLTCLYVDVNGLHERNNLLGHQSGDNMLCAVADALRKYYPEERSYRIGGDEFVMLSKTLSKRVTERILQEMRRELARDNYEISAGVESGVRELAVHKIVDAAEMAMRTDKELYYQNNGGQRRNRSLNQELEKMLTEKRDREYFLKILEEKFKGVYVVDLSRDTFRNIYIPPYFEEIMESADFCYSAAMKIYLERFVNGEDREIFCSLLDYKKLAERLKEEREIRLDYRKVDGSLVNLRILDVDKEKSETIWIFSDTAV